MQSEKHFERHPYLWKIHSAFLAADFWLISKGSREQLGKPIREYQKGCFGLLAPKCLDPVYSYYLCEYLWQSGLWQSYSCGTITWKHLRISDVRNVFQPGSYFLTSEGNAVLIAPVKLQVSTVSLG